MAIPENDTQLWKGFNGHGLYSKRAERDVDGNVIDQTYAKKADVPDLDNALSTSTTTAITPKAVKDAIAEVDVIPTLPQTPSSLYSETSGDMVWGGWETEEIDVPKETVEIGGRKYQTVNINNKWWLAENLDYRFTVDGHPLIIGGNASDYPSTTPHAWYYDNDDIHYGIDGIYHCGLLYNWYAVDYLDSNKNELLPPGWHVATTDDWKSMSLYVGGDSVSAGKLKMPVEWANQWVGTDEYGFSCVPAGSRYGDSYSFMSIGKNARYWSSSYDTEQADFIRFSITVSGVIDGNELTYDIDWKSQAFSVRLVKDA